MGIFHIEKSFRGIRLHISEDIVTEMNAVENEKTGVEFNASVCVCVCMHLDLHEIKYISRRIASTALNSYTIIVWNTLS